MDYRVLKNGLFILGSITQVLFALDFVLKTVVPISYETYSNATYSIESASLWFIFLSEMILKESFNSFMTEVPII